MMPSKRRSQRSTTASYLQRSTGTRNELPRFLIVCEGKKTEKQYFEDLAADLKISVQVRVEGLGDNTDILVERAIELQEKGDYEQVWCVFDRDSFPANRFNRAIQLAQNRGLKVAYSNEAFELWFILHFEYLQAGISRTKYQAKLTEHLGQKYEKNSRSMYRQLLDKQATAIRNAIRLLAVYRPPNPEQDNPSTTVHLLVQELRTFRRN